MDTSRTLIELQWRDTWVTGIGLDLKIQTEAIPNSLFTNRDDTSARGQMVGVTRAKHQQGQRCFEVNLSVEFFKYSYLFFKKRNI
jgi:hypothetical protein